MIVDEKDKWEEVMSEGDYFDCGQDYTGDLLKRSTDKNMTDAALSGIGVMSGIHQGRYREGFFDITKDGKDWKMLEIGCGYGLYSAHFTRFVKEYVGVDVSETIVNIGNKSLREANIRNAKLFVVRGCDLSFIPDNSVDFIFTGAVFIHTPLEVTRKYLEQTYTKLRLGGRFLHHFNVCSLGIGIHESMQHVFTERELDEVFEGTLLNPTRRFDNDCYEENQWMRYVYGVK